MLLKPFLLNPNKISALTCYNLAKEQQYLMIHSVRIVYFEDRLIKSLAQSSPSCFFRDQYLKLCGEICFI